MDVIPVIVNIVEKVLLIHLMTKRCRRCRPKNIPSGKLNQGKEGGKLPPPATKLKWQIQLVDEDVSALLLALKKETSLQTTTQSSHF